VTETPDQPALPPLLAAARALDLDRDAASSGESDDYRRGMTRAVKLLRLLSEDEPAAAASAVPAPATDRAAELEQEVRRLRLMVDEYGAGASALTDKLKRVRDMHRETCPVAQGVILPPAATCSLCEVLDAPAAAVLPATTDRGAVLREAADVAESLRQFEPATGARKSAQVSENVGILRVAEELRRRAAAPAQPTPEPTPDEPTIRATRYLVTCVPEHRDPGGYRGVTVEYRGDDRWAVLDGTLCLGSDGRWDRERQSTERDEEWLATHRFDLGTAWRLAGEQAKDAVRPAKNHRPAVVAQPDGEA
jgi:hypothetical protein